MLGTGCSEVIHPALLAKFSSGSGSAIGRLAGCKWGAPGYQPISSKQQCVFSGAIAQQVAFHDCHCFNIDRSCLVRLDQSATPKFLLEYPSTIKYLTQRMPLLCRPEAETIQNHTPSVSRLILCVIFVCCMYTYALYCQTRLGPSLQVHFARKVTQANAQDTMADLAPALPAVLRGLSQEERKVKRQRLDEFDGLTACRQLTVRGLDGCEVQLPLDDNMTVEDLHKRVAGRIGLRLGGMPLLAAGGNTLDDSKPLLEQVQGDDIAYVVQQVALDMLTCFPSVVGCKRILSQIVCQRILGANPATTRDSEAGPPDSKTGCDSGNWLCAIQEALRSLIRSLNPHL